MDRIGKPRCVVCGKPLEYFEMEFTSSGKAIVTANGIKKKEIDGFDSYTLYCPNCNAGYEDLSIEEAEMILSRDPDCLKYPYNLNLARFFTTD